MNKLKFTAVINCFNEELFIKFALRSVYQFVDEIVVIDNCSSDNTVNEVLKFVQDFDEYKKVKLTALKEPLQLAAARNFALDQASHEWIIKWDGDFCAYTDDDVGHEYTQSFSKLIDIVSNNCNLFDMFLIYSINISGDLYHFDSTRKYLGLHGDAFVGRRSCMRYVADEKYGDLGFHRQPNGDKPRFFYLNNPSKHPMFFVHLYGVKSVDYLLYRMFMSEYQVWVASNSPIEFWEWMRIIKNYNIESGIKYVESKMCETHFRHDYPLPAALGELMYSEKFYKIIYDDQGKISHRSGGV